jgi:predicted transposase YdaD
MHYEFEAIRLWEQPTELFLESTGLLPLAVLTKTSAKAQTLRQVAVKVDIIADQRVRSNVAASAGILAELQLDRGFINQVLTSSYERSYAAICNLPGVEARVSLRS